MNALRQALKPATWFALVAMLALALLPALSHALAPSGQGGWLEVCTAQGMQVVTADGAAGDQELPAPGAGHALEHCPYCGMAAGALGMPPATAGLALPPALRDGPPSLFLQAPRTLFAWRTAQPRGPPALS